MNTAPITKNKDVTIVSDFEAVTLKASGLLRLALAATRKEVTIKIAPDDLTILKKSQYQLCFAKKVAEGSYNVVWQAYGLYLASNMFSWTPQYQLFGSNVFEGGVQVKVSTNPVDIGLGETSILNAEGNLLAPVTGGDPTQITLQNDFGPIHPGVGQISTGINGGSAITPIYIAQQPVVTGTTALTPVEKILVWFEQQVETSTMFSTSRSMSIEIDLTNTNKATRLYKDGNWTTPS